MYCIIFIENGDYMTGIDLYDEILKQIKNNIKQDWTTLEKIRYVYITVGKYLKKDTDFFLSLKNKLGELNLSKEDLYNIYNDDKKINSKNWNKVICKSSAIILKRIFDELGISSKIVETTDADEYVDFDINHYFLCVNDGNSNYFLTLTADLANIQNGLRTEHFGTNIEYYREDSNGDLKQVYKGEEIEHRIINPIELKEIDKKIGYTTIFSTLLGDKEDYVNYMFDNISKKMDKNRWYYDSLSEHTKFYEKNFVDNPNLIINDQNKVMYDNLIKDICMDIEEKIFGNKTSSNFEFNSWYNSMSTYPNLTSDDQKVLKIVADFNKCIIDAYDSFYKNGKLEGKDLEKFKKQFDRKSHKIAEYFVDKKYFPPISDEYATNDYIGNKLELMFNDFFEANTGFITEYNKLSYSEQIGMIKSIFLPMVFKDLNKNNCCVDKMTYSDEYPAILNRIYIRALKNKKNGLYSISFALRGNEDTRYYLYDLQKNIFLEKNNIEIISLLQDNIVCKNRNANINDTDLQIENIENIFVTSDDNIAKK